jgi:hypothetical protein
VAVSVITLNLVNELFNVGRNNYCSSNVASAALACSSGFYAAAGWDPTTGWGSASLAALGNITGFYNTSYFPVEHNGGLHAAHVNFVMLIGTITWCIVGYLL